MFSHEKNPFRLFDRWFRKAKRSSGQKDPNAMCVATVGPKGAPDARMVLLKDFDESGFVFFTNLTSAKGKQILKNPRVALTFHWDKLGLQVRVRGSVKRVSDAEADHYFHSRPRLSQIGAWASLQSRELSSRSVLLARAAAVARKYLGREIPRPAFWTGLRVVPAEMEFWTSRPFRLHDRFLYRRSGRGWRVTRLYP